MAVFWVVAPGSLKEFYKSLRGALSHQRQDDDDGPDDGGSRHI
jgi:hypothetical protein